VTTTYTAAQIVEEARDQDMNAVDRARSVAALGEARRLVAVVVARWVVDPGEPGGPWLKTGFGLTMS
jgi:hypothetical protein